MPATKDKYAHILVRPDGTAVIRGTRMKIPLLVANHVAYKWGAEQLQVQYPDLTLGQIHSALAYYYDHKNEIDRDLRRRSGEAEEFFAKHENRELRSRLRKLKRARRRR